MKTRGIARLLIGLGLLVFSAPAYAQTPQAYELAWEYAAPLAEVKAYQHSVSIDGAAVTGTPQCTAATGTVTACAIAVPTPTAGPRVYRVTTLANGVEYTNAQTIDLERGPAPAGNFTIRVNVTVQIESGR